MGPFKYWTLSNLPLFLLAAPTLLVLLKSGAWGVRLSIAEEGWQAATIDSCILNRLATTQILLAGMAIVGYHVQIITRLSSGCIVWYWWTAAKILHDDGGGPWILKWMIMYGLIQAVLFAGFLPPA